MSDQVLGLIVVISVSVQAIASVGIAIVLGQLKRQLRHQSWELDERLDWSTRTLCGALDQQTTDLDAAAEVRA
jgi:hypothetical protein